MAAEPSLIVPRLASWLPATVRLTMAFGPTLVSASSFESHTSVRQVVTSASQPQLKSATGMQSLSCQSSPSHCSSVPLTRALLLMLISTAMAADVKARLETIRQKGTCSWLPLRRTSPPVLFHAQVRADSHSSMPITDEADPGRSQDTGSKARSPGRDDSQADCKALMIMIINSTSASPLISMRPSPQSPRQMEMSRLQPVSCSR